MLGFKKNTLRYEVKIFVKTDFSEYNLKEIKVVESIEEAIELGRAFISPGNTIVKIEEINRILCWEGDAYV